MWLHDRNMCGGGSESGCMDASGRNKSRDNLTDDAELTDLDLDIHWVEQTEDAVSCAIQRTVAMIPT